MKKIISFFVLFTAIIALFTTICIYFTEKTDLMGLEHMPIESSFSENDGNMVLSWKPFPYPCLYRVETYYKTTGLVEGSPEYHSLKSEYTIGSEYAVPTSAIPSYYQITAYGIFGKIATSKEYIPNPNFHDPVKPVPIFRYTKDKPASVIPYLVWHSVPDGVVYELEILSGQPDEENGTKISRQNHVFSTQQVFTNGIQFDMRPYYKKYPRLYWRVRAMNLRKEPLGVFSDTQEIVVDDSVAIPDKPLLNTFDRMPNFKMPIYPVYLWIPMYGAESYEVELLTHPPAEENGTTPTEDAAWRMKVNSSFTCYDEYARPYAGTYYWRVRGLDANGKMVGQYSDTASFEMDQSIQRCRVAIFGDSITHGGGAVSFSPASLEYSYLTYLDFPAVNLGKSGDTSRTTLERFESDVLPIRPMNLIIMTGSNSLRAAYIPAEAIIADLQTIGQKCEKNGIRPIFMTLPPLNPDNILLAFQTPTDPGWHAKMTAINEFIRKQRYFIDLEPYFYAKDKKILDPKWANDGLHQDVYGKMLIGEIINQHQRLFKD